MKHLQAALKTGRLDNDSQILLRMEDFQEGGYFVFPAVSTKVDCWEAGELVLTADEWGTGWHSDPPPT